MRRAFLAVAAVLCCCVVGGSAVASGWCPPDHVRYWRLSGSYDVLTNLRASDLLRNGWNIELERSIGGISGGDLSANIAYRSFNGSDPGFDNFISTYSFGFKWRMGPGAMPNDDGYYYGLGVGVVMLNSSLFNIDQLDPNFEGRVLAGVDFARMWMLEASYNFAGSTQDIQMSNVAFSFGYRF